MSRLQVLPLPTSTVGEYQHTPFVLVIDQVTDDKEWSMAAVHHLKEHTRAEVVIVHEGTLDVSEPLELTPEQSDTDRRHLAAINQITEDVDMALKHGTIRQTFTPGV